MQKLWFIPLPYYFSAVGHQKFLIFRTHASHINFKICGCKPVVFAPRPPNSCGDVLRDTLPPVAFQMYTRRICMYIFTLPSCDNLYAHTAYMCVCQTSVHLWSFRLFNLWLRLLHIFPSFLVKLFVCMVRIKTFCA